MGAKSKIKYKYKGKLLSFGELWEFSVVNKAILWWRLNKGWDVEDALKLPINLTRQKNEGENKKELPRRHSYTTNTTEEALRKGKINHKLEELIEKRLLEKELEDF